MAMTGEQDATDREVGERDERDEDQDQRAQKTSWRGPNVGRLRRTGSVCLRWSVQPSRSMMVALAMPPPSHMVWRPKRPPVRSSSLSRVVMSLVPEQPSG